MIRRVSSPHSLDVLKPGQTGRVTTLTGPESLRRRLLEIGFVPGSEVAYIMPTPFGDPLVFSLRGTSLALRRAEARCVHIAA